MMALTSGPSTPEVQSFEPISTSDMVDPFSGDFKYNIPLMDVGGYPINIAYNSGISTDQEASWTGLGWNLNVGNISRGMRGIPDDFDGTEQITKEFNMKPNQTFGINVGLDFEVLGFEKKTKSGTKKTKFKPSVGVGINYNTYTGFGVETSVGFGISAGVSGKGTLDASLGLHSSSTGGLDISPNISYSAQTRKKQTDDDYLVKSGGGKVGGTFNSRAGVKQLSFSANFQKSVERVSMVPTDIGPMTVLMPQITTLSSRGGGAGGTINFGLQTYVPHITMPMVNNSVALSIKTGITLFGAEGNLNIGGYYSNQKVAYNQRSLPAYGYMFAEKGQDNSNAMMDFNREKDGSFSRFTKNLPVSNLTYDVYSASGQGVGGTFRPFRHDIGHVFDNYGATQSDSYSLGAELAAGNLIKGGIDFTIVDVVNTTTKWTNNNKALNTFRYKEKSTSISQADDETYYFRAVGEKTADNSNNLLYQGLGGDDAYAIQLSQPFSNAASIKAENKLVKFDNLNANSNSSALNIGLTNVAFREKRNQNFAILNIEQASKIGFQKDYYTASLPGVKDAKNSLGSDAKAYVKQTTVGTVYKNLHHIGEISVLNSDGNRYFYGLPAYNKKQKEVNFNCSGLTLASSGLVSYNTSDASINNSRGIDNSFNSTSVPAYAYSYLLTAIVSVDYVDVTGDGPTDDDLGTYTKFHYKKPPGSTADYNWRMPVTNSGSYANYNEGSKSNQQDQSASYTYGEKELWFLDEIETKNYVAKFQISDRIDALGVTGEHGGGLQTSAKNQQLDKISLYSKPEYLSSTNPVPLKVCNFVYDNSLCPFTNDPLTKNSTGTGKLTLKSINFTYEKSNRALFNSYDFTYSTTNPQYDIKAYDRWGNYKPQATNNEAYNNSSVSNSEFPYTEQNKTLEDQYAQAWHLTNIKLPTGGQINVLYESDDYAFVQNTPAGQMFRVVGASATAPIADVTWATGNIQNLYSKTSGPPQPYTNNIYLIVDGINTTACSTAAQFQKYYLKDLNEGAKKMFFKFLVNLRNSATANPNGIPVDYYEYVSGYADIDVTPGQYGILPNGQAWFKLKTIGLKRQDASNNHINPIALAAIQFGRLNYGEAVWDKQASPPGDIEEALKQLANEAAGSLKTMITGFKNPNKALADKEYCRQFVLGKSMVRLYNGNGFKLGGGSRVKRVELNDNWQTMTAAGGFSQDNSYYGQDYSYVTTDEDRNPRSSGVASYEPMIGSEENSMKQPRIFGKNKWTMMAPDDRYFTEGPYGESFFPSPSVGYEKVRVTSIFKNADGTINANALSNQKNGYKEYQFYTSKDYPTVTEETQIMPKQHRPPLGSLFKIFSRDYIYTSQGYVIRTNDMHGKPKAELDYAYTNPSANISPSPTKEVWFYYKTKGGQYYNPTQKSIYTDASYNRNELDNLCNVISNDGKVNQKLIGVDFDAVADFRESETNTTNVGSQNNLATFLVGVFPGVFPTVWPRYNKEISRFRSAVLTKVVNEYGILERTVVKENGATIATENLAFDSETGDVLVTKTKNEFSDELYSLKYPAHWGYDLMGHAYKNVGIEFKDLNVTNGAFFVPSGNSYFLIGDEVGIYSATASEKAWVCSVSGGNIGLIDRFGNSNTLNYLLTNKVNIKVLRSARRNLLQTEMSTLTSADNPLPNTGGVLNYGSAISINASKKVISANSTVYSDTWQMPKGVINTNIGNNCNCTTVTQTGLDLINSITAIFNNPNNAPNATGPYASSFFNNVTSATTGGPAVVLNSTPNILGVDYQKGNHIYRQWGTLAFGPLISIGISPGPPASQYSPDYYHYMLTQNLYNQLPGIFPPYVGNAVEVGWAGPPANPASSPFNANNQLIGYYMTDDPRCYVTLDFGTTPAWTPSFINAIKFLAQPFMPTPAFPPNTQNPAATVLSIVPNAVQSSCSGNSIDCLLQIKELYPPNYTLLFSSQIKISSSCFTNLVSTCTSSGGGPLSFQCGKLPGEKVNPFVMGIKGNWRSKSNYTYLTKRNQTLTPTTNNTDIRKDGYFTSFSAMYSPPTTLPNPWTINTIGWTNTVETTKYNQSGIEIETKDALGRFSSALYGYNESLPLAVASNARLREIAFDGFEDYSYYPAVCNKEGHFNFVPNITFGQVVLDGTNSHTGKYSLKVLTNQNVSVTKKS